MKKVFNVSNSQKIYKVRDDNEVMVHPMARGKLIVEISRDEDFVYYKYIVSSGYEYRQSIEFFNQCTIPIP